MIKKISKKKKKIINYKEKRERRILKNFHIDPSEACRAYFLFNGRKPSDLYNYRPAMIKRALEFGYMSWPRKITEYVRGKDVLDIGCGTGLHSVAYILVGAKTYTGMDPKLNLDGDMSKNLRTHGKENFGWTPREIMDKHTRITLVPGSFEDLSIEKRFDIAILHNVTEHLMNIEEVFRGVWEKLRTGGTILYHHHNFYCWNGHHQRPRFVDQIDPKNPEHQNFVDWSHLTFNAPADHYTVTKLNRIRLDDLKILTEKYFNIDKWEEESIDEKRGASRYSEEIHIRNSKYTERELTTQGVICIGRKKNLQQ